jgi:hypothetical protein
VPSVVALRNGQTWAGEGAKRLRPHPGEGLGEHATWFAGIKYDMGIRRTYQRAPAGFGSARAIAAEILRFLHQAAIAENDVPIMRTDHHPSGDPRGETCGAGTRKGSPKTQPPPVSERRSISFYTW